MKRVVVDTNVFVAALLSADGAAREVLRGWLAGRYEVCMSLALFAEYRDLLGRHELLGKSPLDGEERAALFHDLMAAARLVDVYFLWRPNLPDEADNHVLELAVAAGADAVVTHNTGDFRRAELRFPALRIQTPAEFLKEH
ncbi:putative toxin-antitoxin system toxin component, PIN family [Pseudothauera rhizosphaerae]|uniref:Putative toxin-antitoxin system toxin component, PIN family n=1 Tax=Pseudothauera rhizosphaerae TaxID=2565932 RepID=A0A4S4ABX4_9RHOO|nr:putative toxin-antitoxin system toxin component, PIN family [Pseudothauera rhizosphaerae]THF56507.1 putative toxin-antitoxin system toxin component, PIN family [Pseudothauera rhizosphaerae]